jgi:hypothetical protein
MGGMSKIAIRCHPCVPISADDLGEWLEHQVMDLRALVPGAAVRLSRLAETLPSGDVDVGWLIELELSERQRVLVHDRLIEAVRDMGLLGFQPTVLESADVSEWATAGNGRSRHVDREWW